MKNFELFSYRESSERRSILYGGHSNHGKNWKTEAGNLSCGQGSNFNGMTLIVGEIVLVRCNQNIWLEGQVRDASAYEIKVWVAGAQTMINIPLELLPTHLTKLKSGTSSSSGVSPKQSKSERSNNCIHLPQTMQLYDLVDDSPAHLSQQSLDNSLQRGHVFAKQKYEYLVNSSDQPVHQLEKSCNDRNCNLTKHSKRFCLDKQDLTAKMSFDSLLQCKPASLQPVLDGNGVTKQRDTLSLRFTEGCIENLPKREPLLVSGVMDALVASNISQQEATYTPPEDNPIRGLLPVTDVNANLNLHMPSARLAAFVKNALDLSDAFVESIPQLQTAPVSQIPVQSSQSPGVRGSSSKLFSAPESKAGIPTSADVLQFANLNLVPLDDQMFKGMHLRQLMLCKGESPMLKEFLKPIDNFSDLEPDYSCTDVRTRSLPGGSADSRLEAKYQPAVGSLSSPMWSPLGRANQWTSNTGPEWITVIENGCSARKI